MKKTIILIYMLIPIILIGVFGLIFKKESVASHHDGPWMCCWSFVPKPKPKSEFYEISKSFPGLALNNVKVLVKLESGLNQDSNLIKVKVKAYLFKSSVKNLEKGFTSKVLVPDYAQKGVSIIKGDYYLLIPIGAYDSDGNDMYDFVRLSAELFR